MTVEIIKKKQNMSCFRDLRVGDTFYDHSDDLAIKTNYETEIFNAIFFDGSGWYTIGYDLTEEVIPVKSTLQVGSED